MEHLPLAVPIWCIDTVEKQAVKVGVAAEVAGGAMNGGDRAALAAGKTAVGLALAIPLRHSVGEDAQHLAQEARPPICLFDSHPILFRPLSRPHS